MSSFTAHESPAVTSKPAATMLRRASTPAWYQDDPVDATHFCHVVRWISARAWNCGPRARMRVAWPGLARVFWPTTGGTEM